MDFKSKLSYLLQTSTILFFIGLFIPVGYICGILTTQWLVLLLYVVYCSVKECEIYPLKEFKQIIKNTNIPRKHKILCSIMISATMPVIILSASMLLLTNIFIYIS